MGNVQWRNHGEQWTTEYSNKLLKRTGEIEPKVSFKPVVMMFGPTGHGKSCFINSISSINKGRKSNIASAGSHHSHVTSTFRKYEMKDGKLSNVVFADVQGLVAKDENAFLVKNVLQIVDGHIKPDYPFNNTKVTSEECDFYNSCPADSEKVHCVIFVFDCRFVDTLDKEYASSTMALMTEMYKKDIPRLVILTHADRVCRSGIQNIFYDKTIKAKVDFVRQYLGVPLENIHPVQNFDETSCGTTNLNKLVSIPLLLALQQALYFACDTIEKRNR